MSSCAASCSMYCRPASCAYATSDALPTATALLYCRFAFDSSATQRRWLLRQHHHPPIRLTQSGTAQSAVEPCTWSNGSPPRNSCFARHLHQTDALHEALSTPSTSARASGTGGSLVSSGQNPSHASLSNVHIRLQRANMMLHPALQSSDAAQLSLCLIPLHRSGRFKVHRLP